MPRIPRSQLPSPAWYHVICRGVEQRPIVLDDLDREAWFRLFLDVERRFGWKVHAWNLLDNHFHLLVETTQPDLSRGMQRLNGVYAMRFNRRYARTGHLFQGRFESRVIEATHTSPPSSSTSSRTRPALDSVAGRGADRRSASRARPRRRP